MEVFGNEAGTGNETNPAQLILSWAGFYPKRWTDPGSVDYRMYWSIEITALNMASTVLLVSAA
jgi:hypothetical protein